MPKYKPETERLKAEHLAKSCIRNKLNQSAVAREEGISHQAVSERFNSKPVQDALEKYLNSKKAIKKVADLVDKGLEAVKVVGFLNSKVEGVEKMSDEFVTVDDMPTRHKYLTTFMQATGRIKINGNDKGNGISTVIISIKCGDKLLSRTEADNLSHGRG